MYFHRKYLVTHLFFFSNCFSPQHPDLTALWLQVEVNAISYTQLLIMSLSCIKNDPNTCIGHLIIQS